MYWGEEDTSVHFCEDKYAVSPYVAEWYNTWSAVSYMLVGIYFARTKLDEVGYALIMTGLGTALLHGTCRYYGQCLDEMSMLFLCFATIREVGNYILSYIWLLLVFGIYLMYHEIFAVFFVGFLLLQIYIFQRANEIGLKKGKRVILNLCIFSAVTGGIVWGLDQFACEYVHDYQLHAWWHVLTALAALFGYNILL
jgi:dihydroceramidase